MDIQRIREEDNADISAIIKASLEAVGLNIPGTAYTDPQLNDLFHYYQNQDRGAYYIALDNDKVILVEWDLVLLQILFVNCKNVMLRRQSETRASVKNYLNMS